MTTTAQSTQVDAGNTAKARAKPQPDIPQALYEVALVDALTCAAIGSMGVSWWHAEVAAGRAPQPAVRVRRCTRWRMLDVREYWEGRAATGNSGAASEKVLNQSRKASKAAAAKRQSGPSAQKADA